MALSLGKRVIGPKWSSVGPKAVSVRNCYVDGGLYHLDEGNAKRKRDPNDPRRAKIPEGPKLGATRNDRIPWTYGNYNPHYHIFRKMWNEPSLLRRRFEPSESKEIEKKTSVDVIKVPLRKKRGPTAVLDALSSTVRLDAVALPPNLVDDPFLLPANPKDFHLFRRSRAMGRRLARRIAEDFPYYFDYDFFRPDPAIPSLERGKDWTFEEGVHGFDETIDERIRAGRFDLAFSLYERFPDKRQEISDEVLSKLMIIASFKNYSTSQGVDSLRPSENMEPEEVASLRDRNLYMRESDSRNNDWAEDGMAEDIWRRIPKTDELHCAYIKALLKHGNVQRAWAHFNALIEEKKPIDLTTFNELLKHHHEIETDGGAEEPICLRIFRAIHNRGIKPSLETFNAALRGLWHPKFDNRFDLIDNILVEMIELGIRPSLGTLGLVLKGWRFSPNVVSKVKWAVRLVEGDRLPFHDEDDLFFFPQAMSAIRYTRSEDPDRLDLAHRLFALATRSDNLEKFFHNQDVWNSFFNGYLFFVLDHGTLDEVYEIYRIFVPHYTLWSQNVWGAFLEKLKFLVPIPTGFLARISNDLSSSFCHRDATVNEKFSHFLLNPSADEADKKALAVIALAFFRGTVNLAESRSRRLAKEIILLGPENAHSQWIKLVNGPTYNNILLSLCAGADLKGAVQVFYHYLFNRNKVLGAPPVDGAFALMRHVAESPQSLRNRKEIMVEAMKMFDDIGAKKELLETMELLKEHLSLDTESAVLVAQLEGQLRK